MRTYELDELVETVKNAHKTLFILCGLPYSGKTFVSDKLTVATGCAYVSIDVFFHRFGYDWTTNKLPDSEGWEKIFTASYDATKVALAEGKNVLYDSTNHTKASRDKLRVVAKEVGAGTAVIFIDVPVDTVWRRWEANSQNPARHVVDRRLVQMTIDSFERPTEDECVYSTTN